MISEEEKKLYKISGDNTLAEKGYASLEVFLNIYEDFFKDLDLRKKTILEFGSGRFEMAEVFKKHGAVYTGIDKSLGVYNVGDSRGFRMYRQDYKNNPLKVIVDSFDGIFCRESVNAFWYLDDDNHVNQVRKWCRTLRDNGWGWILPCNHVPTSIVISDWDIFRVLDIQIRAFQSAGFRCLHLPRMLAERYGQQKNVINTPLFIKNLEVPT